MLLTIWKDKVSPSTGPFLLSLLLATLRGLPLSLVSGRKVWLSRRPMSSGWPFASPHFCSILSPWSLTPELPKEPSVQFPLNKELGRVCSFGKHHLRRHVAVVEASEVGRMWMEDLKRKPVHIPEEAHRCTPKEISPCVSDTEGFRVQFSHQKANALAGMKGLS